MQYVLEEPGKREGSVSDRSLGLEVSLRVLGPKRAAHALRPRYKVLLCNPTLLILIMPA